MGFPMVTRKEAAREPNLAPSVGAAELATGLAEQPAPVSSASSAAADAPVDSFVSPTHGKTRLEVLATVAEEVRQCTRCGLHAARTQTVFARGNPDARIVFVGEGPGFNEDQQGLPFVGAAGQLLDKMISAMSLDENNVYICNVVKCRPPENRTPLPPEMAACMPFLRAQIETIRPEVIVALGKCAAEALECVPAAGSWRGVWRQWNGIDVMPTYHPAFLLRTPDAKRHVWDDLKKVMAKMQLPR